MSAVFLDPPSGPSTPVPPSSPLSRTIILHGFPDTCASMYDLASALSSDPQLRHHCFTPHLPGYAPSTIPPSSSSPITLNMLVLALASYISSLSPSLSHLPLHLIGHDWGSVIAQAYAIKFPGTLSSLTLIAIPLNFLHTTALTCPRQLYLSRYMARFQSPDAGAELMRSDDPADPHALQQLVSSWSPDLSAKRRDKLLASVREAFSSIEVRENALNYYRHLVALNSPLLQSLLLLSRPLLKLMGSLWLVEKAVYLLLLPAVLFLRLHPLDLRLEDIDARALPHKRILLIGGRNDGCAHAELFNAINKSSTGPTVKLLDGAGHWALLEKPKEVARLIAKHAT